jgi:hypothetical protein
MHPQEVREEVGVVAPEVREEFRVFVEPQELTATTSMVRTSESRRASERVHAL